MFASLEKLLLRRIIIDEPKNHRDILVVVISHPMLPSGSG